MEVTTEAMTNTKSGSLMSWEMKFRMNEIINPEQIKVNVVAIPNPSPLINVLVTASRGHRPNKATKDWLLCHRPILIIS